MEEDVYQLLHNKAAPATVRAVPRLVQDLEALKKIFEPSRAPLATLRRWRVTMIVYDFGDAQFNFWPGKMHHLSNWSLEEQ